jgi:GNAT superfamily N-acetyltransferase
MPDARVRRARAGDAAAIEQVRFASWQAAYGDLIPQSAFERFDRATGAARWAERLAAGSVLAYVAEADSSVVGFASYGPCRDDDLRGASEVYAIYVRAEYWSAGVGRSLLSAAVASLPDRPVTLWVLRDNHRARRFYQLAGWSADGMAKDAHLLGGVILPEIRYRLG